MLEAKGKLDKEWLLNIEEYIRLIVFGDNYIHFYNL